MIVPLRKGAAAVALALLLIPVPLALGQEASPEVQLAVFRDDMGRFNVDVSVHNASLDGLLVATHKDPILGGVVDRVIPLALEEGQGLSLELGGMRPDATMTFEVIPTAEGPRRLPGVQIWDPASVGGWTALARVVVPPADVSQRFEVPVDLRPLAQLENGGSFMLTSFRTLVTRAGHVVAAWEVDGAVNFAVSKDGGHSWGAHRVAYQAAPAGSTAVWGLGELADGRVRIVANTQDVQETTSASPWRIVDLDPEEDAILRDASVAGETPREVLGAHPEAIVVSPQGHALVAASMGGQLQVWRVGEDAPTRIGGFDLAQRLNEVRIAARGATVALLYSLVQEAGQTGPPAPRITLSHDGGATFALGAVIDGPARDHGDGSLSLGHLALDADLNVHATLDYARLEETGGGFFSNSTAYYVRKAAGRDATTMKVGELMHSAGLAVTGKRVTLNKWQDGFRLLESTDGGVSFTLSRALNVHGRATSTSAANLVQIFHLPDGRPLLAEDLRYTTSFPQPRGLGYAFPFDSDPEPDAGYDGEPTPYSLARPPPTHTNNAEPTPATVEPTQPPPTTPTLAPEPIDTDGTAPAASSEGAAAAGPPIEASLNVTVIPDEIFLSPDGEARVLVTVRNNGDVTRTLETPAGALLPSGVEASVDEPGTFELDADAQTNFLLRVRARSDAPAGDADARVRVHLPGAPTQFAEAPLRVHVVPQASVLPGDSGFGLPEVSVQATLVVATGGGAVVAVAAFLRTDTGRLLAGASLLPLYTRIKKSDVLQHEVRAGLFDHIRKHPGVRYEELRRELSLANGVLSFHLRVLEREGFITVQKEWTRRRFYPTGTHIMARGPSTVADQLTRLLSQEPRLTPSQVAERLGISRQLARYHLKALERAGRLESEGAGHGLVYRLMRP